MAERVSQEVVEAESVATPNARVSQEVVEAEAVATPVLRISQEVLEAEAVATPVLHVSQEVAEVSVSATPNIRVSQLIVEILVANIEVFMPIVYPNLPTLGYSVLWKPEFFNMPTHKMSTGAELDLGIAAQPLHDFELTYELLRDQPVLTTSEFRTMIGFFGAIAGNLGRFLFANPDDNSVQQQFIATTDGVAHQWPLVRTFGVAEYSWTENIGYVDLACPFHAYFDGNLIDPTTYTISTTQPGLQQIDFHSTPTTGKRLTVDMNYFYYCKLPDSSLTFEKFMKQLWSLKKITLHSCRFNT